MLEILDLSFVGIGRFVTEQHIDFLPLKEFTQVDAINKNTGGSSGSGKSTIFNALDWLLNLNDLPSTVLQSRLTEESMSVSGTFMWDNKPVTIVRGKKLKVTIDGQVIEGSNVLAEEAIDRILGMDRKIFRKLLHKRQKEGGFFLNFTPQKMHEFLIDCLNLTEFRAHSEKVDLLIKDINKKLIEEKALLESQNGALEATKEAIDFLGEAPKKSIDQETVLLLKNKKESSESNLKSVLAKHEEEVLSLNSDRPKVQITPFDRTQLNSYLVTQSELQKAVDSFVQKEKDRITKVKELISENKAAILKNKALQEAGKSAQEESIKLAGSIKHIRAATCPTCEQNWSNEASKAKEKELMSSIVSMKAKIEAGAKAALEIADLENKAKEYALDMAPRNFSELEPIDVEIKELTAKILNEQQQEKNWSSSQQAIANLENEKFAQKQKSVLDKHSAEANQARGQLDIDRRLFDGAVVQLKAYEEVKVAYEANLSSLTLKVAKITEKIREIDFNIASLSEDLILAEEANRAIKTYLSYSFDDAIEAIGNRSTEIIRCIPNMKNATIRFDGTKETKDGKVKEEVNAVIGMDGELSVPIKSLSGGERSAVDIAVDLAVIDYIETKSGKGTNLLILDEQLVGLGPVEVEMALEVLRNSNTNKKIVIVDHHSEIKEMVQDRILVVRDGLTSNIEQ